MGACLDQCRMPSPKKWKLVLGVWFKVSLVNCFQGGCQGSEGKPLKFGSLSHRNWAWGPSDQIQGCEPPKMDDPKFMDIQSSLKTPNWNGSFCLRDGFMCCLHCKQLLEFGAPNTQWGQQESKWSNIGLQDICYWAIPEPPNTFSQIVT